MRRIISLLAIMMLMALMVAASAMPAFAQRQGPPPDCPRYIPSNVCAMQERPLAGPPEFAQGPPEGKGGAVVIECALSPGVAVITPNGDMRGKCVER